jgi:hypothetical protein
MAMTGEQRKASQAVVDYLARATASETEAQRELKADVGAALETIGGAVLGMLVGALVDKLGPRLAKLRLEQLVDEIAP